MNLAIHETIITDRPDPRENGTEMIPIPQRISAVFYDPVNETSSLKMLRVSNYSDSTGIEECSMYIWLIEIMFNDTQDHIREQYL